MPTNYKENVKIALTILSKSREAVTCSHDIISRLEYPFMSVSLFKGIIEKYGKSTLTTYLQHSSILDTSRIKLRELATILNTQPVMTTSAVATTYIGLGECHETSTRTAMELLAAGHCDISLIRFSGYPPGSRELYHHFIVILGPSNLDLNKSLSSLPEYCVVIDPLFKHIGKANTYERDFETYLAAHRFFINEVTQYNKSHTRLAPQILKNAKLLAAKSGLEPYKNPLSEGPIVKSLIESRADPAPTPSGSLCLLKEAASKSSTALHILIKAGALPEQKGEPGPRHRPNL